MTISDCQNLEGILAATGNGAGFLIFLCAFLIFTYRMRKLEIEAIKREET
jgi:hypothetical protein